MEVSADAKEQMIENQLRKRGIKDERILDAMKEVPREKFVSSDLVDYAYQDSPLPIDEEQTISQPYIVALQIQHLDLGEGDIVLDIGTGSGYAAAVMSKMCDQVYTVERHKSLAESARKRLNALGYDNIEVRHGDGTEGWKEKAPFDAINVAAGGPKIPESLKQQLNDEGRMIIPVGKDLRNQRLVLVQRNDDEFNTKGLGRVRFVPLIGKEGWEQKDKDNPDSSEVQSLQDRIETNYESFTSIENCDLTNLLDRVGDAKVVLIGEASHGTSEFYEMREKITRKLIKEKGFDMVAVEADWPDAAHINRYVKNLDLNLPNEVPFQRFPRWMWNNRETLDFVKWLKSYNKEQDKQNQAGFYGLDLYNMYASIDAIINFLEDVDPDLADIARNRYGCLSPYEQDPVRYGAAAMNNAYKKCEEEVVDMLRSLLDKHTDFAQKNGEHYLNAIQNARLVANAEHYYRSMFLGAQSGWNLRDSHMFETLKFLLDYDDEESKAVVWAHNSHLGDARATEMSARGEHNIGQLSKEEWGDKCYNIGFGTDHGTVMAAHEWGGEMTRMDVRASHPDSVEKVMHECPSDQFLLPLKDSDDKLREDLSEAMLERAIGVIYRPDTELQSHYFQASLSNQFDEYIWFDESSALQYVPIQPSAERSEQGVPETYPFGY